MRAVTKVTRVFWFGTAMVKEMEAKTKNSSAKLYICSAYTTLQHTHAPFTFMQ